jgi:uncharacterized protein
MTGLQPNADEAPAELLSWREDRLVTAAGAATPGPVARFVHSQFRGLVLNHEFPCSAAHSSLYRGAYWFRVYDTMGSTGVTQQLAADLTYVIGERQAAPQPLATFIAAFDGPHVADEQDFERLLWRQLQALHDGDREPWDDTVSCDPADGRFSFSFGGTAFFVVGLHAASSRWSRRFAWPTLVFNEHRQFALLRAEGHFTRLRDTVRLRDERLQGDVNPMCTDFGDSSEARQYSGRAVDADWRCPLVVRPSKAC